MAKNKIRGTICCKCGTIYTWGDGSCPLESANDCCNGEYKEGFLQEDSKTFISD